MDLCLKQWREQQHESDSVKLPRLLHQQQPSALPLFATHDEPTTTIKGMSTMGSYFSLAQSQELELQAIIFRHMLAGAAVPPQLLHLLNKNTLFLNSYLPHPLQSYPHYHHPPLVQSGYWGRGAMDPEPGRCRRTDGKKWRCSRDVVAGHKYCERHMHRGRNRSRKPVEIPTPTTAFTGGGGGVLKTNTNLPITVAPQPLTALGGGAGTHFARSGPSPSFDILQLNHRPSESIYENKGMFRTQNELSKDGKSSSRTLRHFFDDWPKSVQEHDNAGSSASSGTSSTSLSISISGNTSSDFSLKLSTGNGNESADPQEGNGERERAQLSWGAAWGTNQVGPMGGPLAEALRSSTSNSSPTSVLHQLQRAPTSETSYIST